jgi:hypothetical protein
VTIAIKTWVGSAFWRAAIWELIVGVAFSLATVPEHAEWIAVAAVALLIGVTILPPAWLVASGRSKPGRPTLTGDRLRAPGRTSAAISGALLGIATAATDDLVGKLAIAALGTAAAYLSFHAGARGIRGTDGKREPDTGRDQTKDDVPVIGHSEDHAR